MLRTQRCAHRNACATPPSDCIIYIQLGLYAAVFSKNIDRALRVASPLESGSVGVKCTSPSMFNASFKDPECADANSICVPYSYGT